jgi:hypothetical protein
VEPGPSLGAEASALLGRTACVGVEGGDVVADAPVASVGVVSDSVPAAIVGFGAQDPEVDALVVATAVWASAPGGVVGGSLGVGVAPAAVCAGTAAEGAVEAEGAVGAEGAVEAEAAGAEVPPTVLVAVPGLDGGNDDDKLGATAVADCDGLLPAAECGSVPVVAAGVPAGVLELVEAAGPGPGALAPWETMAGPG